MKLEKMSQEELEQHSYQELAKMILDESGKNLNTPELFKKICSLLKLSDDDYANKIGDFYTSLTTDKNFISLNDGTWDLRDRHSIKIELDDDDEDEELIETEEEEDEELDDIISEDDDDIDDVDDEIDETLEETDDLTVIEEDELED